MWVYLQAAPLLPYLGSKTLLGQKGATLWTSSPKTIICFSDHFVQHFTSRRIKGPAHCNE